MNPLSNFLSVLSVENRKDRQKTVRHARETRSPTHWPEMLVVPAAERRVAVAIPVATEPNGRERYKNRMVIQSLAPENGTVRETGTRNGSAQSRGQKSPS
jgi:hypothetical protein